MKFDDGVYGSVVLNTHMPGMYEQEILLVGTAGRLRLRNTELFGYTKGAVDGVCDCAWPRMILRAREMPEGHHSLIWAVPS